MRKDVFSVWLKEFCSLIFTQSIQAFILALIMMVIINLASQDRGLTSGTMTGATGIMAIIALAALSKVELLVKKIFGVESQFGDPAMKNGFGGLAGTYMAFRLGKNLLDNGKKMFGGLGQKRSAKKTKAKLEKRKLAALNNLYGSANRDLGESGNGARVPQVSATAPGASGTAGGGGILPPGATEEYRRAAEQAARVAATQGQGEDSTNEGQGADSTNGSGGVLQNATFQVQNGTINGNVDGGNKKKKDFDIYDFEKKRNDILEKYDDQLSKAEDDIKQGRRKMISGGLETFIGAPLGAVGGTLYGLSKGDNPLAEAISGAGLGDAIAAGLTKAGFTVKDGVQDVGSVVSERYKTRDAINSSLDDLGMKNAAFYRSSISRMNDLIDKQYENIKSKVDAGNL